MRFFGDERVVVGAGAHAGVKSGGAVALAVVVPGRWGCPARRAAFGRNDAGRQAVGEVVSLTGVAETCGPIQAAPARLTASLTSDASPAVHNFPAAGR